jgi:tetraacyldisaccharide 4'-kinase
LRPQLARTDALIIVGNGTAAGEVASDIAAQGKPVLRAHLQPDAAQVALLRGKRVLAFAGIGDPARFFATLEASGIEVARRHAFADHHPFAQGEIEGLVAEAARDGLTLATTEKDLARLRRAGGVPDWAQGIVPFAVSLAFGDAAHLRSFVTARLFKARERKFSEGD